MFFHNKELQLGLWLLVAIAVIMTMVGFCISPICGYLVLLACLLISGVHLFTEFYGFIILISLICVCNVFNTISTNIALRRRDFGMLRSVGMQSKELNQMMIYECMRYGIRSLFMGLPLGILGSFGINSLAAGVGNSHYEIPLIPMTVSIISVFVVVFISMLYALSKLKKDNPIEAIRMENL